jgi:glycosyltransferase involved in cell wall biosynthesis
MELQKLVRGYGLEDRVTLAGPLESPAEVIPAFDVSLMTSRSEAFPNFALESLACGVPVVATDVGDCADLVDGAGFVAPSGDVEGLAEHLLRLIEDKELRARLGAAGRKRVEENYSIDTVAQRYRELYESLINRSE